MLHAGCRRQGRVIFIWNAESHPDASVVSYISSKGQADLTDSDLHVPNNLILLEMTAEGNLQVYTLKADPGTAGPGSAHSAM